MRSEEEARQAIALYGDTVRRICMVYLKNPTDTEDIFQTVFIKYVMRAPAFTSAEHEKAWIIRMTINAFDTPTAKAASLTPSVHRWDS